MGAGNPHLRSFDNDKFEPNTYFIDLSEDFDSVKERLAEEFGEEPDDDAVYAEVDQQSEFGFEDLAECLASELRLTPWDLQSRANGYEELSSAFRNEGLILAEGQRVYVITETCAEYSHLPIAVIPTFKFETFLEDAEFELEDRRAWYDARGKSVAAAIDKLAEKRWNQELREFQKEATLILKKLYSWYPTKMSGRCGAWMSGPVDPKQLAA
jgi:hypothetical protein